MAKKMGLSLHKFIAATNHNHVVPDYLLSGEYKSGETFYTIANAMDVGNPSNFPRMLEIYNKKFPAIAEDLKGYWFTDEQIRVSMTEMYKKYNYQSDPHGAVAYSGLKEYCHLSQTNVSKYTGIFLETAHPAKFPDEVEKATKMKVEIPDAYKDVMTLTKMSVKLENNYNSLFSYLKQME